MHMTPTLKKRQLNDEDHAGSYKKTDFKNDDDMDSEEHDEDAVKTRLRGSVCLFVCLLTATAAAACMQNEGTINLHSHMCYSETSSH